MSITKRAEKIAKLAATVVLMTGVIISIGLLSYCGMLAIFPSVALAWIAFALAGVIDGEVYMQNIAGGIDDLKLLGKQGLPMLILKPLNEKKLNDTSSPYIGFVEEYNEQKKYADSFRHKELNDEQKKQKKNAIKRLHRMQKYFVSESIRTNPALIRELKRKIWYLRISLPICIGAGIGFGFATAASLDIALIGLTAALSATIWPLAAIACIGYAFLIYHTVADMICNETLSKWVNKAIQLFKRNKNENHLKYGVRVVGIVFLLALIFSLGILATAATAGTWWIAVKNGALLLPALTSAAEYIRNILVPIAIAANFLFTMRNSLKSVKNIIKKIQSLHPIEMLINTIEKVRKSHPIKRIKSELESIKNLPTVDFLQTVNPFRRIAKLVSPLLKCIIFVGHWAAVGLTGDRAPGLNKEATIASGAIVATADSAADYHFVAKDDEKTHKDHGHHHGFIMDLVSKFILSPLLLLSAVWDFAAIVFFKKEIWGNKSQLEVCKEVFSKSLKKSFGIKNHPADNDEIRKPATSNQWLKHEIELRFSKHEKRVETQEEKNTLTEFKSRLMENVGNLNCFFNEAERNHKNKFVKKAIKEYFPQLR